MKPSRQLAAVLAVVSLLLVSACGEGQDADLDQAKTAAELEEGANYSESHATLKTPDSPAQSQESGKTEEVVAGGESVDYVLELVFDESLESSLGGGLTLNIKTISESAELIVDGTAEAITSEKPDPTVNLDGSGNVTLTGSARVAPGKPLKFLVTVAAHESEEDPQGLSRDELSNVVARTMRSLLAVDVGHYDIFRSLLSDVESPGRVDFMHEVGARQTRFGDLYREVSFIDNWLFRIAVDEDRAWAETEWSSLQAESANLISQPVEAILDEIEASITQARDDFGIEPDTALVLTLEQARADMAELIRLLG